jgi:hypothetical protein
MASENNGSGAGEWAQAAAPEDLMRSLLGRVVQETVEQEFERFIGAGRWERSGKRRGWWNGRKRRRLKTRVGSIELLIPKDREGRFQPSLFGRYERSEQALVLGLMEMYLPGVSTRRVSRIVEELCGFEISASQVSRLTRRLDEVRQALTRGLRAAHAGGAPQAAQHQRHRARARGDPTAHPRGEDFPERGQPATPGKGPGHAAQRSVGHPPLPAHQPRGPTAACLEPHSARRRMSVHRSGRETTENPALDRAADAGSPAE